MPPSDCDFYIYYKPQSQWRRIDNHPISDNDLAKIITTEIEALNPGARVMVAQPVEMRFNEMLEGIRADIAVKIFGNDYDVLERLGSEVKEVLEQIPGTREGEGEVEYETTGRAPMLEIRVKRDVLAKYNLHAGDVNQTIAAALGWADGWNDARSEIAASTLWSGLRKAIGKIWRRFAHCRSALANPACCRSVTLADIRTRQNRFAYFARLGATARCFDGQPARARCRKLGAVRLRRKCASTSNCRKATPIEFGGQFENLREAKARLAIVVPAALGFIFVLIFTAFGSVRQALIVYSGVPFAVTGGVVALGCRVCPLAFPRQ